MAGDVRVVEAINPSTLAKSRKTESEAHHIRQAMEQDGAALAEFFAWFEGALGHETITELTIDEHVTAARARRPGYVCPSFSTIAGFNANGALPHYRATEESHATICMRGTVGDGLLLIDSGGQYEYGTTDITRVVPVGRTTAEQRRDFTLVLKGMIALSRVKFPRGTKSPLLDTIARAPIWAEYADYGHGTGHGVGYFLNVHEGPHGITPHLAPEPQTAMEPGMVTSNEPGLYRPGKWGVRIENLVLNVPAITTEFGEFLQFETLTLCPIDTRLVDASMMTADELQWLDDYHAEVRRRVGPHVSGAALAWLEARTQPIAPLGRECQRVRPHAPRDEVHRAVHHVAIAQDAPVPEPVGGQQPRTGAHRRECIHQRLESGQERRGDDQPDERLRPDPARADQLRPRDHEQHAGEQQDDQRRRHQPLQTRAIAACMPATAAADVASIVSSSTRITTMPPPSPAQAGAVQQLEQVLPHGHGLRRGGGP